MSNMSYCRFQNGLRDLAECGEVLERQPSLCWLHGDELRCAIKLIQMCRDIAKQFEGVDIEALWNPPEKKPPAKSVKREGASVKREGAKS